jgi:hypothetical protein
MLVLNHPVQVKIDTGDEPQEIQHMRAEDINGVVVFLEVPLIDRSVIAAMRPWRQSEHHRCTGPDNLS